MKLFFIIFLSFQIYAQNDIFDILKNYNISNQVSLNEFLTKNKTLIPNNWMLAFESRSESAGMVTPETPRIIRFNEDAKIVMAYETNTDAKTLEVVKQNPSTKELDWLEVKFDTGEVEYKPDKCLRCHKGIDGGFRYIWDSYPDWPGILGQSHNGIIEGRSGSGTSYLYTMEYEKRIYNQILKTENPLVKDLYSQNPKSLNQLKDVNTLFNDLIYSNHMSLIVSKLLKNKNNKEDLVQYLSYLKKSIEDFSIDKRARRLSEKEIQRRGKIKKQYVKKMFKNFSTEKDIYATSDVRSLQDSQQGYITNFDYQFLHSNLFITRELKKNKIK